MPQKRAQDAILRAPRQNKYGAVPTTRGTLTFASRGEARRWDQLCLAERAGLISNLERQVPYVLQDGPRSERVTLIWDYQYIEGGRVVCEDFKGTVPAVFKVKLRWFKRLNPSVVVKISGRDGVTVA